MIYTIGHWQRSIDEFIALLREYGIELLVDVRSSPTSRRSPQFCQVQPRDKQTDELLYPAIQAMPVWLQAAGIAYRHIPEIGGHRSVKHTVHENDGWKNASFRNYADFCNTDTWEYGFNQLIEEGAQHQVAIMCAEPHPSRCHRTIISDHLTAREIEVLHIIKPRPDGPSSLVKHAYGKWGATPRVEGHHVSYPANELNAMKDGANQ